MYGNRWMLVHDHERFKTLLAEYAAARETDPARARERWRAFSRSLRAHAAAEETVLFPAYAANVRPPEPSPIRELLREHAALRRFLDELDGETLAGAEREAREAAMTELLWRHENREKTLFVPWLRACLKEPERQALNEEMVAVRDGYPDGAAAAR